MRVNAWKNVDVECEVDVSLDDCINEMLSTADEDGMPRAKLGAINGATMIMERVTPEMVGDYLAKNPEGVALIRKRLQGWLDVMSVKEEKESDQ